VFPTRSDLTGSELTQHIAHLLLGASRHLSLKKKDGLSVSDDASNASVDQAGAINNVRNLRKESGRDPPRGSRDASFTDRKNEQSLSAIDPPKPKNNCDDQGNNQECAHSLGYPPLEPASNPRLSRWFRLNHLWKCSPKAPWNDSSWPLVPITWRTFYSSEPLFLRGRGERCESRARAPSSAARRKRSRALSGSSSAWRSLE